MLFEILLTALGLSMDAMAISVCNALCYPNMKPAMRWGMPLAFGVFQGLMPLLGYFAGSIFEGFFTRYAGIGNGRGQGDGRAVGQKADAHGKGVDAGGHGLGEHQGGL